MPARSVVIQLQPGIGQAVLPDHRKMVPGVQYVVDWETFQKISNGARQNIISVVSINTDTSTTGSFLPAQTDTGINGVLNLQQALVTTSTTPISWEAAGFAAQGFDGVAGIGVTATFSGSTVNNTLIGPAGERYMYVYNPASGIAASDVCVWADETNRFVTSTRPAYYVAQDGQGTSYVVTFNNTGTSPTTVGTKQGRFAGIALTTIASGYYGWIQIEGICPSVNVSGAITAGQTLAVAATPGKAKSQAASATTVSGNIVSGSALANNVFGTAVTSGTNTTVVVDIRSGKAKKPYVRVLNKN